eukprot:1708435-Prymnesium_polylepis.1
MPVGTPRMPPAASDPRDASPPPSHRAVSSIAAGNNDIRANALLVCGEPASGKTSLLAQLVMYSIHFKEHSSAVFGLVPILVRVTELAETFSEMDNEVFFKQSLNW